MVNQEIVEYEKDKENEAGFAPEGVIKSKSSVASANYLAADHPVIQFSCRTFSSNMVQPNITDWQQPKRLATYFKGSPHLVQLCRFSRSIGECAIQMQIGFVTEKAASAFRDGRLL